jgi:hypothetical protein
MVEIPRRSRARWADAAGSTCRRSCILAAAVLCLTVLGTPLVHAAPEDDLAHARALWKAAAVGDYEYGYNKYCACHPTMPPETLVTVRDGQVVRVRHRLVGFDREVEAPRGLEYYWTIDGLFDLVAKALARHAEVQVAYDAALGYPTMISIDYEPDTIGDEVDLRVTRLDRLGS